MHSRLLRLLCTLVYYFSQDSRIEKVTPFDDFDKEILRLSMCKVKKLNTWIHMVLGKGIFYDYFIFQKIREILKKNDFADGL